MCRSQAGLLEALTGTAVRRLGLTAPDYIDPRSAGTGTPVTCRPAPGSPDQQTG
ncbi:hypothetical protein ACFYO2_44125 [Streptomyces sp. NPDC006602]|uniref:hypothetical protein n=1 Tax=Streptomyces sp. NPDC006602 TaxID=3364751 RepID=UPI0036BA90A5